jgi:CheY-like chemotaxis protein
MSGTNDASREDPPTVKTVLLVEDDADLGEFLVQALHDETSYQALLATDGFQALKLTRSFKPDLFIIDYQLPEMDGLALYDLLHATEGFRDIPVVFISANPPRGELEKRRLSWISKPFELEEMLQATEKLLAA